MKLDKITLAALLASIGLAFGGAASAAEAPCNSYSSGDTPALAPAGATAFDLATGDVTFTPAGGSSLNATDCSGLYVGNDSLAHVEAVAVVGDWGSGWAGPIKDPDDNTLAGTGSFGGIDFVLSGVGSGVWTLTYNADPDVALTMDMVIALKQGNYWAAYYFDDALFDTAAASGAGTYTIEWCTSSGPNADRFGCSGTGISHMSIYFADPGTTRVPLPGSVALLAGGLLGLALVRRGRGAAAAARDGRVA